jgi:putative transposase
VSESERKLKPPNALALKKQFNEIREETYPWTYDVTKCVVEGAFDDLKRAYDNFFAGRAGYPKYKKKGKSHESFYLSNDKFAVGSHWISIPGLGRFILDQRQTRKGRGKLLRKLGTVNLAEKLRFVEKGKATVPVKKHSRRKQVICESVKILGATVSCEAGRWYVSIQVEIRKERPATPTAVVGVDVGLKQANHLQSQLREATTQGRAQAPADRQHPSGYPAQVHHRTGTHLRSPWHRRPEYPGNDGQSKAGQSCG